ncbi:MAG: hypothetical protein R3B70_11000 [Polyangiaceae bacterium]
MEPSNVLRISGKSAQPCVSAGVVGGRPAGAFRGGRFLVLVFASFLVLALVGVLAHPGSAHASPASAAGAAPGPAVAAWVPAGFTPPLPTDGAVAFDYRRADGITGCTQATEAEVRDLVAGVVHADPFVPAGKTATFTLRAEVVQASPAGVRATFSLLDERGNLRGVSSVEDASCDGVHLKLVASIALLLQPAPDARCDVACRAQVAREARESGAAEVRAKVIAELKREALREARVAVLQEQRRDFRAVVSAGFVTGLNVGAEPSPGFFLGWEARGERWSAGLEMRAFPAVRASAVAGAGALSFAGASGLVVPCLRWRWLSGCALFEPGFVLVSGGASGGAASGFFGLGARARVDVPLGAGFEVRFLGDLMGYPAVASVAEAGAGGGAGVVEVPRRVGAFVGLGVARAFE